MRHPPTEEQRAIVAHVGTGESLLVQAYAGSGKSSTAVLCAREISRRFKGGKKLLVAYNKVVQQEMEIKLRDCYDWEVRTFNSLGHGTLSTHREIWGGELKAPDGQKVRKIANHICRQQNTVAWARKHKLSFQLDQTLIDLIDKCKVFGLRPERVDAGTLVALAEIESGLSVQSASQEGIRESQSLNLLEGLAKMVKSGLSRNIDMARQGQIDFHDQIYLSMLYCPSHGREWDVIMVDEAQDVSLLNIMQVVRACRRQMIALGDKHQCQPASTKVAMADGRTKRIDQIEKGDLVMSYSTMGANFVGHRTAHNAKRQPVVEAVASRWYEGPMLYISAGTRQSRCTPNHKWLVRLNDQSASKYCLYVMQKGKTQARVGVAKFGGNAAGMGAAYRARQERANKAWVLALFDTKEEALLEEDFVAVQYGIPKAQFTSNLSDGQIVGGAKGSFEHQVKLDRFWLRMGPRIANLKAAIEAYGKMYEYPIWTNEIGVFGRNRTVSRYCGIVHACNLFAEVMQVRTYDPEENVYTGGDWHAITSIKSRHYAGYVYSLKVAPVDDHPDPYRLYVADGLVTHNSLYQFRGATEEGIRTLGEEWQRKNNRTDPIPELKLTVTFRCPESVVARQVLTVGIEDFKARDPAPLGCIYMPYVSRAYPSVTWSGAGMINRLLEAGPQARAVVLSPTNAPLYAMAALLWRDLNCRTVEDFRADVRMVCDVPPTSQFNVVTSTQVWSSPKHRAQPQLAGLYLLHVTTGLSVPEMEELFKVDPNQVEQPFTLSTVHRAKGLEWDHVYLLPMSESGNLRYVAETRTRQMLATLGFENHRDAADANSDLYAFLNRSNTFVYNKDPDLRLRFAMVDAVKNNVEYMPQVATTKEQMNARMMELFDQWQPAPYRFDPTAALWAMAVPDVQTTAPQLEQAQ